MTKKDVLYSMIENALLKNEDELLRFYKKSIYILAEEIYQEGIAKGENYQRMSNDIANNKLQ